MESRQTKVNRYGERSTGVQGLMVDISKGGRARCNIYSYDSLTIMMFHGQHGQYAVGLCQGERVQ